MGRRSAVIAAYAAVAVIAVGMAAASGWYALKDSPPVTLRVAVGGQGGNIDTLMGEIRDLVAAQSKTLRLDIVHTDGSASNARMVADGRVELASVQADILTAPQVQAVAVIAREHFQLIARRSANIATLRDLAGKRLALPPRGTSGAENFLAIARHHDLPLDQITTSNAPVNDSFAALERGEIEAMAFVRALRDPATIEAMRALQQKGDALVFVPVPQAAAIRLVKPYVIESEIAQGTYQGYPPVPEQDTPTLAIGINLVANEKVPNGAVEELTRILFEEQLRLAFRTPLAAGISRPTAGGPSLPVHAGAKAFYDGARPFLLVRYRDEITFAVSMLTLLYSGLMMLRLQIRNRRKVRVAAYNDALIDIAGRANAADDIATLQACRTDLNALIQRVMRDFSEERISDQGFHVFSLSWEAVRASIAEAIADQRTVDRHAVGAPA